MHQTTTFGTIVTNLGSGTAPTVTVSSATDEIVHDFVAVKDGSSLTVDTSQTERWNLLAAGEADMFGGGSSEAGAASRVMSWSGVGSAEWVIIGVPIKPAAASADSDGDLTTSATITEPIAISSIADTVGERVAVFDFSIADGGTADALALAVSQIVLNTSGTGTFADITWQLDGPDASFVTGTVGACTITFSSLSISVADGLLA